MNILIVDDEYYIVQGILNSVNWDVLNIKEKYCAYSMKQALEVLEKNEVHIILTDIEMPKGSGLDLIEEINRRDYTLIKLLLTGHENFNYAKKALELGCYQYLVKPIQSKELESVLQDAIHKFKQTKESEHAKLLVDSWNTSSRLKYNRFWSEIFNGTLSSEDSIDQAIIRYDLDMDWISNQFNFMIIHRYPSPTTLTSSQQDWADFETELNKSPGLFYIFNSNNCLIVDTDHENPSPRANELLNRLYPKDSFTLYQSEPITLADITQFNHIIQDLVQDCFSVDNMIVIIALEASTPSCISKIDALNYEIWPRLIVEKRSNLILKEIESQYIKKNCLYALSDLRFIYQHLFHAVMNAAESTGHYNEHSIKSLTSLREERSAISSLSCLLDWANRLLLEATHLLFHENDQDIFLSQVKKYIKDHLASKGLNRNSIADEIHMNPDYISYLFHKLSGEHLSTYISNERIHEAKKLLLTTTISLQEISVKTGYSNTSYFHKQFKKSTGMTPQQFRKQQT